MTDDTLICPVCEEGQLHPSHYDGDFKHNGKTLHVTNLECCRCDACGADPVFEEQIRRNHLKVADAKRLADGLLISDEVRYVRERLGLSQNDAAELFGGGANAFSKYERGEVLQSKAMDRLLRLTLRYPFLLDDLRRMAGVVEPDWEPTGVLPLPPIEISPVSSESLRNAKVVEISNWNREAA